MSAFTMHVKGDNVLKIYDCMNKLDNVLQNNGKEEGVKPKKAYTYTSYTKTFATIMHL